MLGRVSELAALQRIWDNVVVERRPQLVTLFGPAGIGKPRLASEFAELAGAGGARVIKGSSLPYGGVIPYGAFATQVKQVAKIFDTDEAATACKKLDRAVAGLFDDEAQEASAHIAMLIGIGKGGDVGNRQTLFFSARRLVEALATDRPTVLVFEDIHWADAGMLDLLEVLASRVRDVPLLLLTLARPDLLERRPGWGGGLPGFTALPVEPLGEEHAKELAAQVLRHMHKARHESAEIGLIGEGNPLFIEELAASVAEDATGSTSELPTTIRGIVAARLDALPPGERAVLLDAAVVGKVLWDGAPGRRLFCHRRRSGRAGLGEGGGGRLLPAGAGSHRRRRPRAPTQDHSASGCRRAGSGPRQRRGVVGEEEPPAGRFLVQREVVRRDVARDLVDPFDIVETELVCMGPDDFLGRGFVDAIGLHCACAVDDHVAVQPGDLRVAIDRDPLRAAADLGHVGFADVELSFDQELRHG